MIHYQQMYYQFRRGSIRKLDYGHAVYHVPETGHKRAMYMYKIMKQKEIMYVIMNVTGIDMRLKK